MNVAVEEFLAAVILSADSGKIFVPREALEHNYSDLAIAIDVDIDRDGFVLSLIDKDEVDYDDE